MNVSDDTKNMTRGERVGLAVFLLFLGGLLTLLLGAVPALLVVVMVGFAVLVALFITRNSLYRRKPILTDRQEVDEEEFFTTYYADSGIPKETVLECLHEAAKGAQVDASRIRATDRFEVEYDPMPGEGWCDLTFFLKDKMEAAGVKEIAQLQSVDEFIRCVWRLETMAKQRAG